MIKIQYCLLGENMINTEETVNLGYRAKVIHHIKLKVESKKKD